MSNNTLADRIIHNEGYIADSNGEAIIGSESPIECIYGERAPRYLSEGYVLNGSDVFVDGQQIIGIMWVQC